MWLADAYALQAWKGQNRTPPEGGVGGRAVVENYFA